MRSEIVISAIRILSPMARLVAPTTPKKRRLTMSAVVGASIRTSSGFLLLVLVQVWEFDRAFVAVVRVVAPPSRPLALLAKRNVDQTTFLFGSGQFAASGSQITFHTIESFR